MIEIASLYHPSGTDGCEHFVIWKGAGAPLATEVTGLRADYLMNKVIFCTFDGSDDRSDDGKMAALNAIFESAGKNEEVIEWTARAKSHTATPEEMNHLSSFLSRYGVDADEYLERVVMHTDHLKEVKDYWNLRSHGFSDAINEELNSHLGEAWKERFRTILGDDPVEVLDDGAGAGFFSMILSSLGHKVTSIDYSDGMIAYIKENMARRGYEANAMQMDAQDLSFEDESFDAVVQRNVIWNLDAPEKAYSEMFRVLRPGGIVVIDDGNHYLAFHDEEYAEEAAKRRAEFEAAAAREDITPGSHYRHNPENVDYTIIERIAKDQPMSHRRRPQWDFDQMVRLGFRSFDIKIDGKGLPQHYLIVARKPE